MPSIMCELELTAAQLTLRVTDSGRGFTIPYSNSAVGFARAGGTPAGVWLRSADHSEHVSDRPGHSCKRAIRPRALPPITAEWISPLTLAP